MAERDPSWTQLFSNYNDYPAIPEEGSSLSAFRRGVRVRCWYLYKHMSFRYHRLISGSFSESQMLFIEIIRFRWRMLL